MQPMTGGEGITEVARAVDVLQKAGIRYRDLQINPGEGGSHFSMFILARQPRPPGDAIKPASSEEDGPKLSKCDTMVLETLRTSPIRLTASQLQDIVEKGPASYSESSVRHSLARLCKLHLIDNCRHAGKTGYGLISIVKEVVSRLAVITVVLVEIPVEFAIGCLM